MRFDLRIINHFSSLPSDDRGFGDLCNFHPTARLLIFSFIFLQYSNLITNHCLDKKIQFSINSYFSKFFRIPKEFMQLSSSSVTFDLFFHISLIHELNKISSIAQKKYNFWLSVRVKHFEIFPISKKCASLIARQQKNVTIFFNFHFAMGIFFLNRASFIHQLLGGKKRSRDAQYLSTPLWWYDYSNSAVKKTF